MNCTCPIEPGMTYQDLFDICAAGKQCCDSRVNPGKGWICPVMDKALRNATLTRDRQERQVKRLKAAGYTNEDLKNVPTRSRRRGGKVSKAIPTLDFDV